MVRHYVLASHGLFAKGIYDSIRIILGEREHVHIICAYTKDGEDVVKQVKNALEGIPKNAEVVACSDLFGGSVNNELMKYIGRKNYYLFSGMNLPMLMNLFMFAELDATQLVERLCKEAKTGIVYCNATFDQAQMEEDEF